jgi:hypothetical protein
MYPETVNRRRSGKERSSLFRKSWFVVQRPASLWMTRVEKEEKVRGQAQVMVRGWWVF